MTAAGCLFLGALAGVFAGFFGIGGGIVVIPALVWIFHLDQHQAQGVSLAALVLPVGILGALVYYRQHPFDLKLSLWIAMGLFAGTYVGGRLAQLVSDRALQAAFGGLLVVAGVKMILGK